MDTPSNSDVNTAEELMAPTMPLTVIRTSPSFEEILRGAPAPDAATGKPIEGHVIRPDATEPRTERRRRALLSR